MSRGKIFLTGGSGFIGSHLCERLANDYQIIIFDNLKRNAFQGTSLESHPNVEVRVGDIRDPAQIRKAFQDCDRVIHCAAIAGIDSVGVSPLDTMAVNLIGTYHLLEVLKERPPKHFIQFSTSEVYGPYIYKGTEDDLTTQGPVGQVRWTYAVSKLAAEHLAFSYHRKYQIPVTSVRPFNIYGPRQVGEGAIQKFLLHAVSDKNIEIRGDGTQIRSWCYISDFIDALVCCFHKKEAIGQVFNIGNPETAISISELAKMIISLTQSKSKVVYKEALESDVEVRVPSIEKVKTILNLEPQIDLKTGIEKTFAWFQNQ